MKKVQNPYAIELQSDYGKEFINYLSASTACTSIAIHYANEGFHTTVNYDPLNKHAECSIYFDLLNTPLNFANALYTYYDITSHTYWMDGKENRVRVKTFHFKTKK